MIKSKRLTYLFIMIFLGLSTVYYAQKDISVGVDEKLGSYLPMDMKFVTSDNDAVAIKDIVNKPVLLVLVYYECPGICSPMLNELAWTINKVELEPGSDYKVISLSFDHHETPDIAAKWKKNYLHSIKRNFPAEDWVFLTGDSISIKKFTDAVGFRFKKSSDDQYIHAGTVITISPDGKISRYLFGTTFNPFDVKMALIDAKAGKTNPTISKVLQFCFSYDPEGRQYTLNITRIIGTIMLLGIGAFAAVLIFKKKKTIKN